MLVAGGRSEVFYRVARAIGETLPVESRKKKLLDGFLAGRERLRTEVDQAAAQARMDFYRTWIGTDTTSMSILRFVPK